MLVTTLYSTKTLNAMTLLFLTVYRLYLFLVSPPGALPESTRFFSWRACSFLQATTETQEREHLLRHYGYDDRFRWDASDRRLSLQLRIAARCMSLYNAQYVSFAPKPWKTVFSLTYTYLESSSVLGRK